MQEFYRELLRKWSTCILLLFVAEDKRLGEDQNLLHPHERPPPVAAIASITRSEDSGGWRRSDGGRPIPTSTSRSRCSSRNCGLVMPLSPSRDSVRSSSRPRRPRPRCRIPFQRAPARSDPAPLLHRGRLGTRRLRTAACGLWQPGHRRSWGRSTSRSSSCTPRRHRRGAVHAGRLQGTSERRQEATTPRPR